MSATIEENKMNTSNKITTLKLVLEQTDGIAKDKLFGLGLGAQRCGSTWIGKYLSNHPEFYISSIKEMHIFDALRKQRKHPLLRKFNENEAFQLQPDQQDILKIYEGKKKYYEYFDEKIESSHTAFGEITPEYSLLGKQFLKIVEESHPNIRYFVSLRRPIGRYLSALSYYGRNRPKFNIEKNYVQGLKKKLFCHYTRYTLNIKNLLSVVPKEKIFFFFYEDLFNGTTDTLFELCNHLEISKIAPENINLSLSNIVNNTNSNDKLRKPNHEEMKAIYTKFQSEYKDLSSLISKRLPDSWDNDTANYG